MDNDSGQSFEHRRTWIEDRIRVLSSLFSISICAYAVMSNHYHLVVKIVQKEAELWTDDDVLTRWTSLYKGTYLVQRHLAGEALSEAEQSTLHSTTAVYRSRLADLSWFMKCLNEPIARQANTEDNCTGHFWESRFKSQALVTEQALIAAMVYVDLNPVRAGMAKTPEASEYTSIRTRLEGIWKEKESSQPSVHRMPGENAPILNFPIKPLLPFADELSETRASIVAPIPFQRADYVELVDVTAQIKVTGKRGRVDSKLAPILERLRMDGNSWPIEPGSLGAYLRMDQQHRKKAA